MNNHMNIGEVIRAIRKEKGMSQTELAKGICSKDYIYAIENNKNMPSGYILEQLSQKLDFDLYGYYQAIYRHISWDTHLHIININEYMIARNFPQLKKEIDICLELEDFKDEEPYQILLFAQSYIVSEREMNFPKAIDLCKQALHVKHPDFSLDKLSVSTFSYTELTILSQLARNYMSLDQNQPALDIYTFLYKKTSHLLTLRVFDLNVTRHKECNLFLIICLNLAVLELRFQNLNKAEHYICNGLSMANRAHDSSLLPAFLLCRCHLHCIRKNYRQAVSYLQDAQSLCKYSQYSKNIEGFLQSIVEYHPELKAALRQSSVPLPPHKKRFFQKHYLS